MDIKEKLKKVYALVDKGATEGERAAAKKALDRILKQYNLDESVLNGLDLKDYLFPYSSLNERILFGYIVEKFVPGKRQDIRLRTWDKKFRLPLTYLDFVTVEASYQYFRRHMKIQWKKAVKPQLDKCRKAKTKKNLRLELDQIFIERYIIASDLIDKKELTTIDISELSKNEMNKRLSIGRVEGGAYNKQVEKGVLMLNE